MKRLLILITILFSFILDLSYVYALDININEVKILDKSDNITVGNVETNNLTITPNITFNSINDYVIYKITFKGNDIKKYEIKNITDDNKSDNIKTTYKNKGETLSDPLYITMIYEKEAKDTLSLDDINITIDLLGEDNEEEQIIINNNNNNNNTSNSSQKSGSNPDTGTLSHIITPLILIVMAVFIIKYYFKHKNDTTLMILIICLTIIPLSVIAYESQKLTLVLKTTNISIGKSTTPSGSSQKVYHVYLYPNGGTGITEGQTFEYTETTLFAEFPSVTRSGCTLEGWNVGSVNGTPYYTDVRPVDDGSKLYARWKCETPQNNNKNKILLIAGHSFSPYCNQVENECRENENVNGYSEPIETRIFVQEIKKQLISLGYSSSNVDIANELLGENFNDHSTSKSLYAEFKLKEAGKVNNISKIDFSKYVYAIEVHFNASTNHNSSGVLTLCNQNNCGIAGSLSNEIRSNLSSVLKSSNLGTSDRDTVDFTFFDANNIPFTYLETEYYDNKTAMDNFKSKEAEVALAIAKCIKKYYP